MRLCFLLLIIPFILFSSCDNEHKYKHYIFSVIKLKNSLNASDEVVPVTEPIAPYNRYVLRLNLFHLITEPSNFSGYDYTPICDNSAISIEVRSSNDFDETKPSGSLLNDYFVYYLGGEESHSLDTIFISAYHLHDPHITIPETFDLYLTTPPAEIAAHEFSVQLNLADGTYLTDTTELITIQP